MEACEGEHDYVQGKEAAKRRAGDVLPRISDSAWPMMGNEPRCADQTRRKAIRPTARG